MHKGGGSTTWTQNSDFHFFFALPIGLGYIYCRWSEVTVGSKDPLRKFLMGKFVQEGSSGTRFDPGQFGLGAEPLEAHGF